MQNFYIKSVVWDLIFNLESDITLDIRHGGAAFRICYHARTLEASPYALEQHRELYRILYEDDPDGGSLQAVERLRKPFEELMTQMAPNPPTELTGYLHSHLYPPWFILVAKVDESGCVQPYFKAALSRQEFGRPGEYVNNDFLQPHLSPLLNSKLNKYSSHHIQVLAQTSQLVPSTVLVDGTVYFFKPWISGRVHGYHELQSYRKILTDTEASPPLLASARICRLHGLVIDDDDDVLQHYPLDSDEENYSGTRLVGLLLTCIENRGTLKDLAPWSDDCTNKDRLRWSRQIHHSVECLHNAGVIWGDAKPENVLIDMEGDAWLIDFGGSYTPGWVDEDKRETVEGDQQGVQRIDGWLTRWSRQPVTRIKRSDEGGGEGGVGEEAGSVEGGKEVGL
ncbi:hypothetical protein QC764_0098350 [Podospora pseudoanserina]|uniref:Protein kinase domain-containing protein n=1 Tax=Podospora pseudoanserina TaxID=2609844 RepID=A0ABR0HUF1_9PEZI|nr:hypothetical protein QC764_0098350 [Podospora pseudoanserina]